MILFPSRPFFKSGFYCLGACVLAMGVASAQTPPQTDVVTEQLLSLSAPQSFALPNFSPSFGPLTDVTLTMNIATKTYTIFDTNNPSNNWVDLTFITPGSAPVDGDNLSAWGNSLGNLDVTYHKPPNVSVADMGIAGLLLYCTPRGSAAPYINANYTYDLENPNGGGGEAIPSPAPIFLRHCRGGDDAAVDRAQPAPARRNKERRYARRSLRAVVLVMAAQASTSWRRNVTRIQITTGTEKLAPI